MLKGKIDEFGLLKIERGSSMNWQYCPYNKAGTQCGDWCPLFGEPMQVTGSDVEIDICNGKKLVFHNFIDKR